MSRRGLNTAAASMQEVSSTLSAAQTHALLGEVPGVYHTQINDVLLAALSRALGRWSGAAQVLINLEGHGREPIVAGVDLARTVGWFTSVFPVQLSVDGAAEWGEHLKRTKETLRAVPHRGIGYGILRYLSGVASAAWEIAPEVSFNYLGQLNDEVEGSLYAVAPEAAGWPISPQGSRAHLIDVVAIVSGQQLQVSWWFGTQVRTRQTVAALAEHFMQELRDLIHHCLQSESKSYPPSDGETGLTSMPHAEEPLTYDSFAELRLEAGLPALAVIAERRGHARICWIDGVRTRGLLDHYNSKRCMACGINYEIDDCHAGRPPRRSGVDRLGEHDRPTPRECDCAVATDTNP